MAHLYEVHCSGVIAEALFELQEQVPASKRKQIAAAFRRIIKRLQNDPMEAGEPSYHLPAMRMVVRTIVIRPLVVAYGVNEDQLLVFIKNVKLLEQVD